MAWHFPFHDLGDFGNESYAAWKTGQGWLYLTTVIDLSKIIAHWIISSPHSFIDISTSTSTSTWKSWCRDSIAEKHIGGWVPGSIDFLSSSRRIAKAKEHVARGWYSAITIVGSQSIGTVQNRLWYCESYNTENKGWYHQVLQMDEDRQSDKGNRIKDNITKQKRRCECRSDLRCICKILLRFILFYLISVVICQ